MKNIKILLSISTLFLFSACTPQKVLDLSKRQISTNQATQQSKSYQKAGEEFRCLVVDESYDAQAHCRNRSNTKKFYTTHRDILKNYRVLHKMQVSTDHTNTLALPNYRIAKVKLWVVRK